MTLTLYNQADLSGAITMDGATVPLTLTVPGQRARYTFSGTAGQWVNVGLSSVTITSSNVLLLKPDGTQFTYNTISTAGGSVDPTLALPTTGTYTIVVDPASTSTGAITLTLSSAVTGSIMLDGSSASISLTRVGQTARYTFTGTAGQQVNLGLTSVTFSTASVSLIHPNGNILTSTSVGTSGGSLDPSVLPTTGTYTILVDPSGVVTGAITLTLSTELTGSLTIGAAPVTISLSRAGQNARYAFAGTSGQQTTVRITNNTIPGCTSIFEYKPDGTWLTYGSACSATLNLATQTLPTTGTYQVFINPSGVNTGTLDVQVTNP